MTKIRSQKFKKETAPKLLKIAKDDLYTAEILSTAPKYRPETVLYHIQQSIEKSIKAVLIFCEQAVLLTHDIDVLMAELRPDLKSNLPTGVGELTQYATIRRYTDGDELIDSNDIQEAVKIARFFTKWATSVVHK